MKKKRTESSKVPIGTVRVVKEFLPPPDKLVLRESNLKVTLALSSRRVDFFKRDAKK